MDKRKLASLLVCNEAISARGRGHATMTGITLASVIELVVKIGSIVETTHFFAELAMRFGAVVRAVVW